MKKRHIFGDTHLMKSTQRTTSTTVTALRQHDDTRIETEGFRSALNFSDEAVEGQNWGNFKTKPNDM